MTSLYQGVIALLDKFGFFNIILPWMLIYAITYGILLRTEIFGKPFPKENEVSDAEAKQARTISSLVALSVASLVIGSYQAVINIRNIIPLFALFILIIVCLIIIISAFTLPEGSATGENTFYTKYKKYLVVPASIIFILILLNYFGFLGNINSGGSSWSTVLSENKEIIEVVIIFIFFGLVVFWSTREPKSGQQTSTQQNQQQ